MDNNIRLASPIQFDSIVDGPGIRCVLWTQGCIHKCKGCHNPQTHDVHSGTLYDVNAIIKQLKESKLQNGLTLSGGEPFLQAKQLLPIVIAAKEMNWNIWAYTGFLFEKLKEDENARNLLNLIDIVVDGKFIEEEKDFRLVFKGSKNQRIVDVQRSLKEHCVILSSYDDKNMML